MKKYLSLITIICFAIISVGCSKNKTVECKLERDQSGIKQKLVVKSTFSDDQITNFQLNHESTLDDTIDNINDLQSALDEVYGDLEGNGVNISTKQNDKTVTIKLSIDSKGLTNKDNIEKMQQLGFDITAKQDDYKKALEDNGYTCN